MQLNGSHLKMFGQTVSSLDLPLALSLIFLEGMLSIDNALVIALLVKRLPSNLRQKALFIGLVSSIFLRALGILGAFYLMQYRWIKLLGGLYLLYLSLSHIFAWKKREAPKLSSHHFWTVVVFIELVDFIFAIDSILAGVAFIESFFLPTLFPSKLWIVYIGGLGGLILMRFGAKFFVTLLERFPRLELGAYCIIGWVGLNLLLKFFFSPLPPWTDWIFPIGGVLFFLFGLIKK